MAEEQCGVLDGGGKRKSDKDKHTLRDGGIKR